MKPFLTQVSQYNMNQKAKELTKEDYEILCERRGDIETCAKLGVMKNIGGKWIQEVKRIHMALFQAVPLNINCSTCLHKGLSQLWYAIERYEAILLKEKAETEEKEEVRRYQSAVYPQPPTFITQEQIALMMELKPLSTTGFENFTRKQLEEACKEYPGTEWRGKNKEQLVAYLTSRNL